ncbi:uncharacterized protein LOC143555604 [Bidens hawaiensis]|uniref:uncharacterized protein LOC143555604 n=1 Tax=Bidens hawaiensis TaxID=980011 RepID=UPI00404912F0
MLSDSKLLVNFWTEAVASACYTLNRVLTVKKFGKTCFELLNRRKPNLKWLEQFGCACTVLETSGKFGPKSIEGFFVAYASPLRRNLLIISTPQDVPDPILPDADLETTHVFDDGGEIDEEIIEAISPSSTEVAEDDNVNNLQTKVSVPTEVILRTFSYHLKDNVIGDLYTGIEPKTYKEALTKESWVNAMQEELMQFEKLGREGIDYNEVYAPVARLEVIRIFLAFSSWKGFKVYQLDFKSAFLNGKISEEVYFEEVMKLKFEMSAIREMKFFLGLQVEQLLDGIFIHQTKYVNDILAKFNMSDATAISTPLQLNYGIDPDPNGLKVDQTLYQSMIGSLMYLTASRPDIMYATCLCA